MLHVGLPTGPVPRLGAQHHLSCNRLVVTGQAIAMGSLQVLAQSIHLGHGDGGAGVALLLQDTGAADAASATWHGAAHVEPCRVQLGAHLLWLAAVLEQRGAQRCQVGVHEELGKLSWAGGVMEMMPRQLHHSHLGLPRCAGRCQISLFTEPGHQAWTWLAV